MKTVRTVVVCLMGLTALGGAELTAQPFGGGVTTQHAARNGPTPTPQRLVVPHLREGFGSGAWQVLDPITLGTVGKINFQGQEWPVFDVDAVQAGDMALLLTQRASGSAVRAINLSTGKSEGLVVLPANERIRDGVDPIIVGNRMVYAVILTNGSGALRSIELTSPITAGPGFFFDPSELPACDIEPLLTLDGTKLLLPTFSWLATGNIRVIDAMTLAPIAEIPLNLANQELPMTGLDPLLTPDGMTALFPLYDNVQKRGRIRFVDLDTLTSTDVPLPTQQYPVEDVDVLLSQDGALAFWPVANGVGTARLKIFDVNAQTLLPDIVLGPNEYPIRAVDPVLTPDGTKLLFVMHTGSAGAGRLRIVDVGTLTVDHTITLQANDWPVVELDVAITPDGQTALWQSFDAPFSGNLHMIDIPSGVVFKKINFEFNEVPVEGCDIVLNSTGTRALVTTWNSAADHGILHIVDTADGSEIVINFPMNEHPVPHVDPIMLTASRALIVTNDAATAQIRLRLINVFTGAQEGFRELLFGESSRIGVDVLATWLPTDPDDDAVECELLGPVDMDLQSPPSSG